MIIGDYTRKENPLARQISDEEEETENLCNYVCNKN